MREKILKIRKNSLYVSPLGFLLITLLLVISGYANSLYSPFVFDDFHSFINNSSLYLKDFSFAEFKRLLGSDFGAFRLIPISTFALDHLIGQGKTITTYHISNIIIHLSNTTVVALLVKALLRTEITAKTFRFLPVSYVPIFIAALWALSPVQTNAVTYIVQRMASLAAFFYLAAMLFYVLGRLSAFTNRKAICFTLCALTTVCAFFSKENSAMIPFALLLIEALFISPETTASFFRRLRTHHYLILVAIICILLPLLAAPFEQFANRYEIRHFNMFERLLTETRIIIFYISLLLFPSPSRMSLDHDITLSTSFFSPPTTILSIGIIFLLLTVAFVVRKRNPLCSFGIFFFFLNLAIESTFIPLELIFEHRLYLPSFGFAVCMVVLLDRLFDRFFRLNPVEAGRFSLFVFLIISCLLSIMTTVRNIAWSSYTSISHDSYIKSPNKARAAASYAVALGMGKKYDEAIKMAHTALSLGKGFYEDDILAINTIVVILNELGRPAEAVAEADKLIKKVDLLTANSRDYHILLKNIAKAHIALGNYSQALVFYIRILQVRPYDESIYADIGKLYLALKNVPESKRGIHWDGKEETVFRMLADIAYQMRQYDKATRFIDMAQLIAPEDITIINTKEKIDKLIKRNKLAKFRADIENDPTYQTNSKFRFYMQTAKFIMNYYPVLAGSPLRHLIENALLIDPDNKFAILYMARWHIRHDEIDKALHILNNAYNDNPDFFLYPEVLSHCYIKKLNFKKSAEMARKTIATYHGHPKWQTMMNRIGLPATTHLQQNQSESLLSSPHS